MEFYFLSKIYNKNGVFEFDLKRQNLNKSKVSNVLEKKDDINRPKYTYFNRAR